MQQNWRGGILQRYLVPKSAARPKQPAAELKRKHESPQTHVQSDDAHASKRQRQRDPIANADAPKAKASVAIAKAALIAASKAAPKPSSSVTIPVAPPYMGRFEITPVGIAPPVPFLRLLRIGAAPPVPRLRCPRCSDPLIPRSGGGPPGIL